MIKDKNHLTNDKTTDVYNTVNTNSNYFLGHTRYATSGNKDSSDLIQPIKLDTNQIVVNNLVDNNSNTLKLKRTPIFFAFNGNIKESLWDNLNISYPFLSRQQINTSLNDTQKMKLFIEYLLNMSNNLDFISKIILKELPTAFCLIISTNDTTWIIRDSLGNRPLSIWSDKNISNINDTKDTIDLNKVIISSETNVINQESEFYNEDIQVECDYKLDEINEFQKKLRKFYNYYQKIKLIFNNVFIKETDAFIIDIKFNKIKVYIPELNIEHSFNPVSYKFLETNTVYLGENHLDINGTMLYLHQKIKICVSMLRQEKNFNRKIRLKLIEPFIETY